MELEKTLKQSKAFFEDYISSFDVEDPGHIENFRIKREHSLRVVENIVSLADKLEAGKEKISIAALIAMFHDIGRFPQLASYGTFNDAESVDHAQLSIDVLKEHGILDDLDEASANLVYTAILWHNKFELDDDIVGEEAFFSKLIRDADKIDILKVITDYYVDNDREPNHTLTWELPEGRKVSDKVAKAVVNGKLVSKQYVESQIDIKVMQMSWVYDLNFKPSFRLLAERRYIDKIYKTLPKNDDVIQVYRVIKIFLENQFMS